VIMRHAADQSRLYCVSIAEIAIVRRRIRISQEWMNIGLVNVSLQSFWDRNIGTSTIVIGYMVKYKDGNAIANKKIVYSPGNH
jgi:hypothetical protein